MKRNSLISTTLLASIACTPIVFAAELPAKPYLTLEVAKRIVSAAESSASSNGWPAVIAVTDDAGRPILIEKMDDAEVPAGIELAPGKARTAALFRRSSGDMESAINGKRPATITARDFILMKGGIPLIWKGTVVGAIGVSTSDPEHDVIIAQKGVDALRKE